MSGETVQVGEDIELWWGYARRLEFESRHLTLTAKTVRFIVGTPGVPGAPVIDVTLTVQSATTATGTLAAADAQVTTGTYTYGYVVDDELVLTGTATVVPSP